MMRAMRSVPIVALVLIALVACKQEGGGKQQQGGAARGSGGPATPRHVAPAGTIGGKPFAPTVVVLAETSDGGRLGLYAATAVELRDRQRCDEPIGSASTFEITKYEAIADWKIGAPVTSQLDGWSATGVDWNAKPKGAAKITLSKKDPKTFTVAGTIEMEGDGWKLVGPFEGDYCPTKSRPRGDKPEPLAGAPWTMAPIPAAAAPPQAPIEAIVAGEPAKIAHVTLREVPYHDGTKRQRFIFYTAMPPEPCAARPDGSRSRLYSGDKLLATETAAFRIDNFSLDLTAAPVAGAALVGNYHHDHGEKKDQIVDADLQVFEPDGARAWRYAQYFSAALAVDGVTDTEVRARVQLSLPDQGKSALVGAFTAKRCPPEKD
jgi:hypothetical protein